MTGVVRMSAWDLAVECVDRALDESVAPSLERLGRLGQLGSLPSFVAALSDEEDLSVLNASAFDHTRERESLGLAPSEVAAELLVLGRVLDEHGEAEARVALDRCIAAFVERVTGDLSDRAARDPLTCLLNHEAFHARLEAEVARARRYRGRLAVVLFDLDRFKETNDREGHPEGDRILRAFATALEQTARTTDVLGRLGGDEFGALLLEVESGRVTSFLQRLRDRLAEGPAASAGAAFLPDEGTTPEQLVGLADRRLYEDKAARAA
jgi:diguanylate cyclase (GGDEF)-like protein